MVAQIRKGIETSAIHIGYPGFLGVSVDAVAAVPARWCRRARGRTGGQAPASRAAT